MTRLLSIALAGAALVVAGTAATVHADTPHSSKPSGRLGIQMSEVDSVLRDAMGVPKGQGVFVHEVEAGSPAAKAGIKVADIVLEIERTPIADPADARQVLDGHKKGDKIDVLVLRDKKRQHLTATLTADIAYAGVTIRGWDRFDLGKDGFQIFTPPSQVEVERLQKRVAELEKRIEALERATKTN